jgi:diaminopimelate epimerase
VELGNPGVPHAVKEWPGLDFETAAGLKEDFRSLRFDPAFPKGANVNYFRWLGDTEIRVLTFERGVEDYTLACGTGTASVVATLWQKGLVPGGKLTAQNQGGTLTVTVKGENGTVTELLLEGPTEVVKIYEV